MWFLLLIIYPLTIFTTKNCKLTRTSQGKKFPGIRNHIQQNIGDVYKGMYLTYDMYPSDETINYKTYLDGIPT